MLGVLFLFLQNLISFFKHTNLHKRIFNNLKEFQFHILQPNNILADTFLYPILKEGA